MKIDPLPLAIALGVFLIAISLLDLSFAADTDKAYLALACGALFFAASIFSRQGGMAEVGAEAVAIFATLLVAALVVFSLPFPISMLSLVSGQKAVDTNVSQGNLTTPRVVIDMDMVDSELFLENSNLSGYRIVSEIAARGLTRKAAARVLERCKLQIQDIGGNITVRLTGPKRLQVRVRPRLTIQIPANVTANLLVKLGRGSLNLTGLACGRISAWIKVGRIDARSLDAWTCEMSVDNGPIDIEVAARQLQLQTIIGDIRVVSLRPETGISAESVNGKIEARLNFSNEVGYLVEADNIGGSIQVNLTNVVLTKQKSGFISVRSRDLGEKKLITTVYAKTTTGNLTIAQI